MAQNGSVAASTMNMTAKQFEDVFNAIGRSNLLAFANDWNTVGGKVNEGMEGGNPSLASLLNTVQPHWKSGGAQVLYDNASPMKTFGLQLGAKMTSNKQSGSVATPDGSSMSGMLAGLDAVNKQQYPIFLQHQQDWNKFVASAQKFYGTV